MRKGRGNAKNKKVGKGWKRLKKKIDKQKVDQYNNKCVSYEMLN